MLRKGHSTVWVSDLLESPGRHLTIPLAIAHANPV